MVVQHNLTAMNSNRQLGITTGLQAKSSEKLSSGYKINHQGIKPDIVKDMDPRLVGKDGKDIQLQRAVKYLREGR